MKTETVNRSDELLTVEELAAWLKIRPRLLYNWAYEGTGPRPLRVGGKLRYRSSDVDELLQSCERWTA